MLTSVELHVWCIFSFSSCFKQNIVVIVSRCSQRATEMMLLPHVLLQIVNPAASRSFLIYF